MPFQLDGKILSPDRPFTHDGIQYPSNWLRLASIEEKQAIGITEVPGPRPYDQQFYWGYDQDGELIPKRLNDEEVLDEEGNSTGQIQTGLKTLWINKQKEIAASLLATTDWYVVRNTETGTEIPSDVLEYRQQVREISNTREQQIQGCDTTDELVALLKNPPTVPDPEWQASIEDPDTGELVPNPEEQQMIANPAGYILPWPV